MLRLGLLFGTNIAILVVFSLIFRLLGLEDYLASQGIDGNLTPLLVFYLRLRRLVSLPAAVEIHGQTGHRYPHHPPAPPKSAG